ncbi:MAG: GNAT family N-acetyltransferase [Acidimicrobiales bacterium]|nr:GNAT family N-acetyltransferase [Acidimicrobiales bacterium]
MADLPPGYPSDWETDALLKDGATVQVRPIRPDDADRMRRFHKRQSQESIYFRYFRYRPELSDKEVDYFTTVDYATRMAFIALLDDDMVAVSRYEGEGSDVAEVAFFVDDEHHGRGLATLMLEYLAQRARTQGITTFTATVLSENYRMLGVFRSAGFDVSTRFEDGAIAVKIGIANPAKAQSAIDARDQQARSKAVARFFEPTSVAVVGAGRAPGSAGHEILRSILAGGFTGKVVAVNPNATEPILGALTIGQITDLDDPVDLAIVAIPAPKVLQAVEQCVAAGVKAVVVVSAGFSEVGAEGEKRLAELVALVRRSGVRLVGPLSYGVINTSAEVSLAAHFLPVEAAVGSVGLLSQSGPLGAALLNQFAAKKLGVSTFMSAGIRADVSVYDVLQYWITHTPTTVVALYLENFGNPRNFVKVARQISLVKPVVAVAPADLNLASVARAGGIVLVDRVSELGDQVQLFSSQPLPQGPRVAIVSNATSVARLARTAALAAGLEVVAPSAFTEGVGFSEHGDSVLVDDADTLSLSQSTDAGVFERAVVAAAVSDSVDSVLLALVSTPALPADELDRIVSDVDRAVDKPVVAVNLVGAPKSGASPPTFAFPEQATDALGRMVEYARWTRTHAEPTPAADPESCAAVIEAVRDHLAGHEVRVLDVADPDAKELFEAFDLPVAPAITVHDVRDASHAAERLGYPVALKAAWQDQRRAGEAGGTVLDIRHRQHLKRAFGRMGGGSDRPIIVQAMQITGAHLRVRVSQSPASGSHLFIGVGGIGRADLPPFGQMVLPAATADIDQLLFTPGLAELLTDHDPELLRPLVERLSVLAECVPNIAEIDLNPTLVSAETVVAVEARVTLRQWPVNPLAGMRTV